MKVGQIFAVLGVDFKQFDKDEKVAKTRTEGLGNTLSGILKNAFSFTLGMTFLRALRLGINATARSALDFYNTVEQAEIGFSAMLGDAQKAFAFIRDMADFAAYTPFELPQLLNASKRMMALGFAAEDALPMLTAIGDTSVALGKGEAGIEQIITGLGYIQTQGRVTSRAMMLLAQAGVPSWQMIADAIGVTTGKLRELVQKGAVSASVGIKALVDGMNERFGGLMEKMEESWKGLSSTIRDLWRMTLGDVTRGLFEKGKEWLRSIREIMIRFREAFQQGGLHYAIEAVFGPNTAYALTTITVILKNLWAVVSGVGRTIVRYWSIIGPLTMNVVKAFLAFKLASFAVYTVQRAIKFFNAVSLAMRGELLKSSGVLALINKLVLAYRYQIYRAGIAWAGTGPMTVTWLVRIKAAIMGVNAALGMTIWPILLIGALVMGGISLWSKYEEAVQKAADAIRMEQMEQQQSDYAKAVNKSITAIEGEEDALDSLAKTVNKNLQSFDEVHQLTDEIADLDPSLLDMSIPAMSMDGMDFSFNMDEAIALAKEQMGGFWGWLKQSAIDAFGSVKQWALNLWDGVKDSWTSFKEWCGGFWGNLKLYAGQAWNTIKSDASALWEGVKSGWGAFKDWAGGLWDAMKTKAAETWEGIRTGAANGWENIKTTVATKWEAIKTGAANTWEQVKTGASNAWQSIKTGAAMGWDGIKTVISTKWDSLKAGASATWNNVKSIISQKWNELKTEAPTTWENIKTSISTRWNDLKSQAPTVWENVKNSIASRWNALKAEAPITWESIKTGIATRWDQLKASAPGTWDSIKTAISSRFDEAKANVLTAAQTMYDKVPKSWDEMRSAIEQLRGKVIGAISGPFESAKETVLSIVDSAKNWGKNLISNIVDGIKAKAAAVKSAVQNVASTIKGWLGFGSPTKEGPGRHADEWAPNFMRMFAQGIITNTRMVQDAMFQAVSGLSPAGMVPISTMPVSAFSSIAGKNVGSSGIVEELMNALRNQAGVTTRPIEVILEVDGRRLARATLPAFEAEQDRSQIQTSVVLVKP